MLNTEIKTAYFAQTTEMLRVSASLVQVLFWTVNEKDHKRTFVEICPSATADLIP